MRKMLIGFGGLVLLGWILRLISRQRSVPLKLEQIQTQGQRLTQALTALRSGQVSPDQVLTQIRTQSQRLTEALGAVQRSGQGNPQQVLGQLREQSRRLTQAITGVQQVLDPRANRGPLDEQPPAAG
jgi:septal ring factor EnvC (AmiA/AmiB activator)